MLQVERKPTTKANSLRLVGCVCISWINEKLPAADILISEREIVHIANKHSQELALLSMKAFNYVTMIINQSNEVRKDSRDALFFIVSGA